MTAACSSFGAMAVLMLCSMVSAQAVPGRFDPLFAVLEERCWSCHSEAQASGGLRLDVAEDLLSVVNKMRITESTLFERMSLPASIEGAMPPTGPRVDEQTLLLAMRWINEGAPLQDFEHRAVKREALAAAKAALQTRTGALVAKPSSGDEGLFRVDWSRGLGPIPKAATAALSEARAYVRELSLAGRSLEDLEAFAGAWPELEVLDCSRVQGVGVLLERILPQAPKLKHLRLVEAEGLQALDHQALLQAPALQAVWLAGSDCAETSLDALRTERPTVLWHGALELGQDPFAQGGPRSFVLYSAQGQKLRRYQELTVGQLNLVWERDLELKPEDRARAQAQSLEIWRAGVRQVTLCVQTGNDREPGHKTPDPGEDSSFVPPEDLGARLVRHAKGQDQARWLLLKDRQELVRLTADGELKPAEAPEKDAPEHKARWVDLQIDAEGHAFVLLVADDPASPLLLEWDSDGKLVGSVARPKDDNSTMLVAFIP